MKLTPIHHSTPLPHVGCQTVREDQGLTVPPPASSLVSPSGAGTKCRSDGWGIGHSLQLDLHSALILFLDMFYRDPRCVFFEALLD